MPNGEQGGRLGLRADKRKRVLLDLAAAAIEVFEAEGPGATMQAIADRAGVSRRSAFRYASRREELLFVYPRLWLEVFDAGVAQVAARPLRDRLFLGGRAIAEHIDEAPDLPRRAMRLTGEHPQLGVGYVPTQRTWIARIADEVSTDDDDDPLRGQVIGSAMMGLVDAVSRTWVLADPSVRFADLWTRGFGHLEALLASGVPSPPHPAWPTAHSRMLRP